jgi:uncharacterized ferredoxin-like protein
MLIFSPFRVEARTAPKACGVDLIQTIILDGEDKDRLTAAMREIGTEIGKAFFSRDAGNVDTCHCIILIGAEVKARGLNCGLCGTPNCAAAGNTNISCAMSVNDLGIATVLRCRERLRCSLKRKVKMFPN